MSRILLADDSPHAQRMGERILSDEGYEVVTVSDGDSALLRLEDVDPDLVLADIVMPRRSGYEVCQYVKLSPRHRHTRVVLTAGVQESVDDAEVTRARADAVLRKPFEASELLRTLKPLAEAAGRERPGEVRAAVTVALDAAMGKMVDEITEKVLHALSSKHDARQQL
ncbi:MAG: response regulator [Acidobacteria bacterium]|nr:response regulator [Acidobacteriota bacterium]